MHDVFNWLSCAQKARINARIFELFTRYVDADDLSVDSLYRDPDLSLQTHPAEISKDMIKQVSAMLQTITWDNNHVVDFLGKYLTEPKPDVVFEAPRKIGLATFCKQLSAKSLSLDLKSQLLFSHNQFYLNGELLTVAAELSTCMRELADKRCVNTTVLQANIHAALAKALFESYLAGYVEIR